MVTIGSRYANRSSGSNQIAVARAPRCNASIDLYEVWGKPDKAAEYRALMPAPEGDEAKDETGPDASEDSAGD